MQATQCGLEELALKWDAEKRDLNKQLAHERSRREALEEQLRLANCDQANTEAALNDSQEALRLVRADVLAKCAKQLREGERLAQSREVANALHGHAYRIERELATLDAAPGAITTPTTNLPEISSKPGEGKA